MAKALARRLYRLEQVVRDDVDSTLPAFLWAHVAPYGGLRGYMAAVQAAGRPRPEEGAG